MAESIRIEFSYSDEDISLLRMKCGEINKLFGELLEIINNITLKKA
jgi:hypothetical protein